MGSSEAALFAYNNLDKLYSHFRKDYVDEGLRQLKEDAGRAGTKDIEENAGKTAEGVSALDALADLAEENRVGYEVSLRDIPVRQFTIEISELFGLNPFEMKGNIDIRVVSEDDPLTPDEYKTIGYATKKLERIYLRD